jgi:hypothetical protein
VGTKGNAGQHLAAHQQRHDIVLDQLRRSAVRETRIREARPLETETIQIQNQNTGANYRCGAKIWDEYRVTLD